MPSITDTQAAFVQLMPEITAVSNGDHFFLGGGYLPGSQNTDYSLIALTPQTSNMGLQKIKDNAK